MNTQLALSTPIVTVHDGKAVTTSQDVAKYFHKLHKNVITKIESLDCSSKFNGLNFKLVEYTDAKGEKRPMYEMTKNGFVFLVIGFTGKKAAQFKEAYIAEFDRMEAELLSDNQKLNGRIVLTLKDGVIVDAESITDKYCIASFDSFKELATRAGWLVINPDDLVKKLSS